MKVTAKFTGADDSLGFRTGEVYVFKFNVRPRQAPPYEDVIVIKPEGLRPRVIYNTLKLFLNNWTVL